MTIFLSAALISSLALNVIFKLGLEKQKKMKARQKRVLERSNEMASAKIARLKQEIQYKELGI